METLRLGFSPCPNDTFIFHAMLHGQLDTNGLKFEVHMEDVEALNGMVAAQSLDVAKLSYHAYLHQLEHWQMLPSGSALGFGVGPLLIAKQPLDLQDMADKTIAIPGANTTAHFLLKVCLGEGLNTKEMLFSDIEAAVLKGQVDAGVIIHENRFTYADKGLHLVQDLGAFWENKTGQAIPLGGIAVRRNLPEDLKQKIQNLMRASVAYAQAHPKASAEFVACHAQEMDADVMKKHIDLYVNQQTLELDEQGVSAVQCMVDFGNEWGWNLPQLKLFV